MKNPIALSHVAVLVPSVRKAADFLHRFDFNIGKEEIWDEEGTKEIYVERAKANSLLLMEAIKEGAYQRALRKRGPGLHHIAINVFRVIALDRTFSFWTRNSIKRPSLINYPTLTQKTYQVYYHDRINKRIIDKTFV